MLQNLPDLDLEATVLNRLAVLEVLCKNQAQTISVLQAENSRLQSSLTASTSVPEVLPNMTKDCHSMLALGKPFAALHYVISLAFCSVLNLYVNCTGH